MWTYRRGTPAYLPGVEAERLVKHMTKLYADRHVDSDLDAVVRACASTPDVAVVEAYAKARKASPGFKPGSFSANNHDQISPAVLAQVMEAGSVATECGHCGGAFIATDKRRKYCSTACHGLSTGLRATLSHEKSQKKAPGVAVPAKVVVEQAAQLSGSAVGQ